MMTCLEMNDGILRARVDGELSAAELAEADQHLAACADCSARLQKLSVEASCTGDLLTTLAPLTNDATISPAVSYAHFRSQFIDAEQTATTWIGRLFAPRWRPAWGFATAVLAVTIIAGVSPVRSWAQRVLTMLRVQKIAVVSIDPSTLMNNGNPDSHPYKLVDQFLSDNVVVTMKPGKPEVVANVAQAAQLAGYPIQSIGDLGAPQSIRLTGETAFQMTLNRERMRTLLDEIGRSDISIPESVNGALIAVHIPKTTVSAYGECPEWHTDAADTESQSQPQAQALAKRKMEMMKSMQSTSCVYLVQAPSPTVSVPPDLNMAAIAEAALELAGMSPAEARSFCETVDWSSTLVVPIPSNTSSYETVNVDGVEGTLITETRGQGTRYSLLWVKNGMIHSLTGPGNATSAMALVASLR